ncbi:MAG: hypothetical protein KF874_15220 [Rhizobiaceae bacterium]|nr:hypothetical protein [Rhizobiaceae bacterium]
MTNNFRPFLDAEITARAFERVRSALEEMLRNAFAGRAGFAVVVSGLQELVPVKPDAQFRENCLLVTSIGDLSKSPYPNMEIALSKAEISVRTRMPSSRVPQHFLRAGDTVYSGSAILDGIIVACAGLEPRDDEMISYWIAAAIKSEVAGVVAQRMAANPSADFFSEA